MNIKLVCTSLLGARQCAGARAGNWSQSGLRQSVTASFRGLTLIAVAAMASILINSGLAPSPHDARTSGGIVPASEAAQATLEPDAVADRPEYHALSRYLAQRYSIAAESAQSVVHAAFDAGEQFGLDPLLLLAVMAIESRFNPFAHSVMGAKGLMQIMPRQHRDILESYGGDKAVLDPMINIEVGAQILKEYIDRGGSLIAGLRFYNGAPSGAASRYPRKVIAERDRLEGIVREMHQPVHDDVVKLANVGPSGK
jgi:soluble lytic murein transglycosylase-like protein